MRRQSMLTIAGTADVNETEYKNVEQSRLIDKPNLPSIRCI